LPYQEKGSLSKSSENFLLYPARFAAILQKVMMCFLNYILPVS